MKKWIAIFLSAIMLLGILTGCNSADEQAEDPTELEEEFTPDDKMTIAICALARSINAQKEMTRPVCYSVSSVKQLDGIKQTESACSYDNETMFVVEETRYFEGDTQTGSESYYTYVLQENGKYNIISAKAVTEKGETTKTYSILYTADTLQEVQNAWTEGAYGRDMNRETYGKLEQLILDAALSEGGTEAQITSADDFTLTITKGYKTQTYTVVNNFITRHVWTEMTTEGESEHIWNYAWYIAEATLPNLADFTLVSE